MRTYLKWGVVTVLLGTLAYLAWGFTTKLERKKAVSKRTQTLPSCRVQAIDGQPFTLAPRGKPIVLIYFEPDCEHCQREARELRAHQQALAGADIVMLSAAPIATLSTFANAYGLTNPAAAGQAVPNLRVAHIDRAVAHDTFGFVSVPDVLIYHANGTLSRRFKGETSIAAIAKQL